MILIDVGYSLGTDFLVVNAANPFLKAVKALTVGQKEYKYYDLQSIDSVKFSKKNFHSCCIETQIYRIKWSCEFMLFWC